MVVNSESHCPTDRGTINNICIVSESMYNDICCKVDVLTVNGVSAELITDSGDRVTLHGIRVLWMIKSEYSSCQLMTLRVELNHGEITVNDSSAEFYEELPCNRHYRPSVKATMFTVEDSNTSLFYGGNLQV